jgi:hypothetical protein
VADRWAFVVATDRFLDPGFGPVPYAEAGAKALAEALAAVGYPKERQTVLLGPHATKAVIDSRLRKLAKAVRKGDSALVSVSGRAVDGRFLAHDSLADDLPGTGVGVADLVATLAGSKAAEVTVLIEDFSDGLDDTVFAACDESAKLVCLTAGAPAHAAARLKAGVWTHLVVEALSGRAAKAADRSGSVTALSLHRFIADQLPRVLRKHFEAGTEQTPRLYGEANAGQVIADLSPLLGAGGGDGLLDPARLKRVAFRSESRGRVKDLTHWRKTFSIPETAGPSSRKFVARIAQPDLAADLDGVFEACREHLGYKRKDLDRSAEADGFGYLRTPDFEYTATVALDPDEPSDVIWRREVGQFADPGFVRGPGFDAVFGKLFDQLVFEFARPVDVEALVDRLEDRPPKGAKVKVAGDGASCEVTLAGFSGRVTVDRQALTVRGRAGDAAGLLDQFLAFLGAVGPLGEPLMLK